MRKPFGSLVYDNFNIDYYDELIKDDYYLSLIERQKNLMTELVGKSLKLFLENDQLEGEIEGIIEKIYFTQGFNLGVNAGIEFARQKFPNKKQ